MHRLRFTLLVLALATFVVACWLTGCGTSGSASATASSAAAAASVPQANGTTAIAAAMPVPSTPAPPKPADPIVVLHTTEGDIQLQLFAEKAPQTVNNFLSNYAQQGFYDDTIFHHVEVGSMLIGGGFSSSFEPKLSRTPIYNESRNGLTNHRGAVAMIREPDSPHTATSQFFINLADNPDFDFKPGETEDVFGYCVFGEVVAGLDVVERIAQLPTTSQGEFSKVPSPAVAIRSVERLR
jgi:peptidyl-prolyl cis-trans isomerase A (cyclophilin A)